MSIDSYYEVTVVVPVSRVILAQDREEAEMLALGGLEDARNALVFMASIGQISIGFPESLTVKEIGQPATKAD